MAEEIYEKIIKMTSNPYLMEKRVANKPIQILLSFVSILGLAFIILLNIIFIKPTLNELLDFGSFLAAGIAASDGGNPYASDLPLVYTLGSEDDPQALPSPNLNPPISVILFKPLAGLDPLQTVWGWRIATVIQFGIAVYILGRVHSNYLTPLRILWALSLAGLWTTIAMGQVYASILLLSVCVWVFAEKGRYVLAGIALGAVVAIKPNFALWLLLLGVARQFTMFLSATVTTFMLSLLPIPVFGIQIYKQWLVAISEYPSIGLQIAGNSSLHSLSARLGVPSLGVVAVVLLVGMSIYITYRNRDFLQTINALGIIVSLLASPFAWAGYTLSTLPIFLSRPQWKWDTVIPALLMIFPYILIMYLFNRSNFNSILFGWLYGWGLIILLVGLLIDLKSRRHAIER